MKLSTIAAPLLLFAISFQVAAQDAPETEDQAKIRATIEGYVDAFNERDAAKLASYWTEKCDYIDMTGRMVVGRESIQTEYEDYFRMNPGASMNITVISLDFAGEGVAIEDGVREIVEGPNIPPKSIRYTAIHVHDGEAWLVKSVRDALAFEPTNYQYLRGLEWMVGEWIDEEKDGIVFQSSCEWSPNRNFMIKSFASYRGEELVISGTQWIGWDPVREQIRSWLFDSNGGFGEGNWTRDGASWRVESTTVLPSGKVVRETHVLTFVDVDKMTFEAVDRTIDDEPLPDVKETVVQRKQEPEAEPMPLGVPAPSQQ